MTGTWLDDDPLTFRLSRAMLEQEGYAFTPVIDLDDPLFFTTPYPERLLQTTDQAPACFRQLNLTFPSTLAEVKAAYRKLAKQAHPDQGGSHEQFLALQAAYEQALRLCRYGP
ncbi:MAG TPA: DnaJ domain-containing protein [Anaerolineae bacterium]